MTTFRLCTAIFLLLVEVHCNAQTQGIAVSTDSTPVYYRAFGSGKPLLIINGGPGMNSDGFEGLAKELSVNNRAILYDQRGTGKSTVRRVDSTTITMDLMIDDIECLRKHLGVERWSVLGHSFGGMLASYYAARHPERIERLILSSSGGVDLGLLKYAGRSINARLTRAELDSVKYWTKRIDDGDTSHYARLARGMALAPAYLYNRTFVPVIAERLTQGNSAVNALIWSDLQKMHFDCSRQLMTFDKPVLIIQGKQDIIKPETARRAQRVLKNSKVVFVEHCSHYGWLDNREKYLGTIDSFLAADK